MIKIQERYEKYWQTRKVLTKASLNHKVLSCDLFETVDAAISRGAKNHLDIGCGDGIMMDIARDKVDTIYGCDISKTAVSHANRKGMRTICVDLNIDYLPFENGSFDGITCMEVIEHVFDPLHLLQEIYRVLDINGELVITTPNFRHFSSLIQLIFRGHFPHTTGDSFVWGGGHIHFFTRKDLMSLLKDAGFKNIKFHINIKQFKRSYRRKFVHSLIGSDKFGEWFCNGIIAKALKA